MKKLWNALQYAGTAAVDRLAEEVGSRPRVALIVIGVLAVYIFVSVLL